MKKLDLYYIDLKYIRDLSQKDDSIMSISPQRGKENRPFIGVIVLLNGYGYCIPLTSPKNKFLEKKSQVDFIKIFDKSRNDKNNQFKLIGVLNINNMIPVTDAVISKVDLTIHKNDSVKVKNIKTLMQKQLSWCRDNAEVINNRAQKVYNLVTQTPEKSRNLTRRCCDFKKLESVLEKRLAKENVQRPASDKKKHEITFSCMQREKREKDLRETVHPAQPVSDRVHTQGKRDGIGD